MLGQRADELRRVAEQVVGEAAAFVRSRRTQLFGPVGHPPATVRAKSTPTDPVTLADTETERLVRDRLAQLRPGDAILGEEQGENQGQASGVSGAVRWVVDPIDGTVNFIYGIPVYAVSLAAQVDWVSVAGAVADVCEHRVYAAAAGRGAWVTAGDERTAWRCTGVTDLSMALVGTGFGYEPRRRAA